MALSLSKKVHTEDIEQETCYLTESRTAHWNLKESWTMEIFLGGSLETTTDRLELDTADNNVAK